MLYSLLEGYGHSIENLITGGKVHTLFLPRTMFFLLSAKYISMKSMLANFGQIRWTNLLKYFMSVINYLLNTRFLFPYGVGVCAENGVVGSGCNI